MFDSFTVINPRIIPKPSQQDSSSENGENPDDDSDVDPMGYGVGDDVGDSECGEDVCENNGEGDDGEPAPSSTHDVATEAPGSVNEYVLPEIGELPFDHVPVPDTVVPEGTTEPEARDEGLELVRESEEMEENGLDGAALNPQPGDEYFPDNQLGLEDSPAPKPSAAPDVVPVHSCARPLRRAVPLPDVSLWIDSDEDEFPQGYLAP